MAQPTSSALRALALEYKSLQEEPVEGFRVKLVNEDNMFEWEVAIFGPPDTLYQGGYFKAHMKFPPDYPYSPPSIRFMTKVWHPNVYEVTNVDASVMYRRWRDSKGRDKEYENIIRKQAQAAKVEAEKEGIVVPITLEDYCIKTRARPAEQPLDMTDFYDDEYELDDDDDDEDNNEQLSASDYEDGDDSGNGES
ncbi:hypothetical protein PV327_002603 [Microctonus hyperodae]|uniref:UBC core domain-containing protein n=1 Tax=Microctonus hyperodae TaxID=165561 RepID=A0AA39KPJ7_MICHY|nr:hypothetical protein PV327_002603 [Microctonus hyperodae]